MARKREKVLIIVHASGLPRGPDTGDYGMHPRVVGGPWKAQLCLRRGMQGHLEALQSLVMAVPSEPKKAQV